MPRVDPARGRDPGFARSGVSAALVAAFCFTPVAFAAEPTPGAVGPEMRVNVDTDNAQQHPSVAVDADGDYVVAWQSAVGDSNEIRARLYDANGVPRGAEIQVNTWTSGAQRYPDVAIDADGDFVVAWQSDVGGSYEIRARRFGALGAPLGPEFQVNQSTAQAQKVPSVAMSADGAFVVAWQSNVGTTGEIRARRYGADGVALGAGFRVDTATAGTQDYPSVAMDAHGAFVVGWRSKDWRIDARRFDAAGVAQGEAFSVGYSGFFRVSPPAVAMDADGDFAVTWREFQNKSYGVYARRYDAAGVAQGAAIQVPAPGTAIWVVPAVAMDATGGFVVAWEGAGEIRARRFSGAGVAQDGDLLLNSVTTGLQTHPAIALDADGDFVAAWATVIDASLEVGARRFQGAEPVDIDIVQSDSADPAPAGTSLRYTLRVSNLHAPVSPTGVAPIDSAFGKAVGLHVVDVLPAGAIATAASGTNWTCSIASGRVDCWYLRRIAAGRQAYPLTIEVTPPGTATAGTILWNVAYAGAIQFDADHGNNRVAESAHLVSIAR